ncbi:MAG: hypothetical protein R6V85_02570 [Polyangia bacterium]
MRCKSCLALRLAALLSVLLSLPLAFSCGGKDGSDERGDEAKDDQEPAAAAEARGAEPEPAEPQPVEPEPVEPGPADEAPDEPAADAGADAAAPRLSPEEIQGSFEWTKAPRLEDIPEGRIRGVIDGRPFTADWVCVQPGLYRSWRINISREKPVGGPLGLTYGVEFATIYLSEPPEAGGEQLRAMAPDEKGFVFLVDGEPGEKGKKAAGEKWHSSCAWAVEITSFEVKDWDPEGQMGQLAGEASGRLALCCEAEGGVERSWLAGEFEHAPVRYMGVPWWAPEDQQKKFLGKGRVR